MALGTLEDGKGLDLLSRAYETCPCYHTVQAFLRQKWASLTVHAFLEALEHSVC
jgi:hypothetical protein